MTKDEALKLALEALQNPWKAGPDGVADAIIAIKEALAQPEPWEKFCDSNCVWTDHHPDCKLAKQEPVAWEQFYPDMGKPQLAHLPPPECKTEAEKTAYAFGWFKSMEAQRTWVGLTDEEYAKLAEEFGPFPINQIEAKLKEKNT
jgi:hypothetical protein